MRAAEALWAIHNSRATSAKASFSPSSRSERGAVHQRSFFADQKKSRSHVARIPQAKLRIMPGLGKQILQCFQMLWWFHELNLNFLLGLKQLRRDQRGEVDAPPGSSLLGELDRHHGRQAGEVGIGGGQRGHGCGQ